MKGRDLHNTYQFYPDINSSAIIGSCICVYTRRILKSLVILVSEDSDPTDVMQNMTLLADILLENFFSKIHHTLLLVEFSFFVILKDKDCRGCKMSWLKTLPLVSEFNEYAKSKSFHPCLEACCLKLYSSYHLSLIIKVMKIKDFFIFTWGGLLILLFHPLLLLASWLISHQHRIVDISLKVLCLWRLAFFCPWVVLPPTHSCLACLAVFLSTFKTQFRVDHIWKCDSLLRMPGLPLLLLSIFFILDLIPTGSSVSLLDV